MEQLLVLDGVGYRVQGAELLAGISLELGMGQLVGVVGPNGAGKSTLLGLLNGSLRATAGRVWRRRGVTVATVLQHDGFNALVPLTVTEVVTMGRTGRRGLLRRLTAGDRQAVTGALAELDIASLAQRTYRSLSGGEKQKVQLARALCQEPAVLLLDEPTSALDLDWQERLVGLIDTLARRQQLTIVMTTHHTHHLPAACGRVLLMRHGSLLADGAPEQLLTADRLAEVYGCPVQVTRSRGRTVCLGGG